MTSYVIARTLGDPTASTSHKSSFTQVDPSKSDPNIADASTAAALITALSPSQDDDEGATAPTSATGAISESTTTTTTATATATTAPTGLEAHPTTYFVDGEGEDDSGAARLAGVGVFSPVASMPGSPTLSRRRSYQLGGDGSGSAVLLPPPPESESEHGHHERTASGESGVQSTSGESSFTLLEREESFDDPATAAATYIRRRVPGPPADADTDD